MKHEFLNNDQYLEHHGVLGQKWGVKNGPPYPIDPEKSRVYRDKVMSQKTLTGKLKKASKYKSKLTDKDLDHIMKRIDLESRVENQKEANIKRLKNAAKDVDKFGKWTTKFFTERELKTDPSNGKKYYDATDFEKAWDFINRIIRRYGKSAMDFTTDPESAQSLILSTLNQ